MSCWRGCGRAGWRRATCVYDFRQELIKLDIGKFLTDTAYPGVFPNAVDKIVHPVNSLPDELQLLLAVLVELVGVVGGYPVRERLYRSKRRFKVVAGDIGEIF